MSMGNMKLHKMEEWESVFHTKQIEHVYYTSDMLVRKVTGYTLIPQHYYKIFFLST